MFWTILTWLLIIAILLPIGVLFLTSIKSPVDATTYPPKIIFTPNLRSYHRIFTRYPFLEYAKNSLFVTIINVLVVIPLGIMAAYSLSRFRFRGSRIISFSILLARMLPAIAVGIPYFMILRNLSLINTTVGLAITYFSFNLPFSIWMLIGFIQDIPRELDEMAQIDGCSIYLAIWKIIIPLLKPGIVATSILIFIFSWNEFMLALLLTGADSRTLPVAATGFIEQFGIEWTSMSASGFFILIPIFIFTLIVQRYLVRGLTMGGIK
ncbi:MAG: carbohydrate ABC transporter permease [Bacteroidia bacterium]|nr:carbohydrate ABC transporter permease [Bacteroidia bacterium]